MKSPRPTRTEFRLGCLYRVPSGAVVRLLDTHKPHPAFLTVDVEVVDSSIPGDKGTKFSVTNPEGWRRVPETRKAVRP